MMKDPYLRFFQMEHPVSMILAVLLITLGYGTAKKNIDDQAKYKKALRYFIIALILIIVAVPWPIRGLVARPLFPGM
jgi:membrane protein DedA with SNARE-associated domain